MPVLITLILLIKTMKTRVIIVTEKIATKGKMKDF